METEKYVKFDIPEWVNWLARDSNEDLFGYLNKPKKGKISWYIGDVDVDNTNTCVVSNDPNHYPQVKWSDEEPSRYMDGITIWSHDTPYVDTLHADGIYRTPEDAPTVKPEPEPDMIQNPPHYKQYSFEPIDIITEVVKEYPPEIGFHVGTVLKYLFRSPFKGKPLQDLEKAEYYLQRAIKELEETK